MDIWLNAGFVDLGELPGLARTAEAYGFTGIDIPDHLFFPAEITSTYPYSDDGEVLWPAATPWADPWVAIAAMAVVTDRLHFGTGIQIVPLRDPFSLAKAIATANEIAGGRIQLGVGAGWLREEFDALGIDFASRGKRLDEMLTVMQLLWSGEVVEHRGAHFSFDPVSMKPPAVGVPIHVGGNSPVALRRASRHDGWIGTHRGLETTATLMAQLTQFLDQAERSMEDFAVALTGPDLIGEDFAALAGLGVDAISLPLPALGRARSPEGRLELVARVAGELGLVEPASGDPAS